MKGVFLFFKALFSGRILLLTIFSFLTFGASLLLVFIHQHETLSKILSDIGIAFLTAAIVTSFDAIKGDEVLRLLKLFSISPTKKTAIVIAQFDQGYVVPNPNEPLKQISLNEIPSTSKVDSFTANYFVALFQSHGIDLPEVITDAEAIAIVSDEKRIKKYGCFVSVGLSSNKFSKKVAEKQV